MGSQAMLTSMASGVFVTELMKESKADFAWDSQQ
jgi:hypothetical protein